MTDQHETLTRNELVDDLDRKYRLARPVEELRDDPDVSREQLLCCGPKMRARRIASRPFSRL